MPTRVLGVVLAGGKSSRMGRDKACLPYGNHRLVDEMVERVSQALRESGETDPTVWVSGAVSSHDCVPDGIPGLGPLGGILSVLEVIDARARQFRDGRILLVPVDMPALKAASLTRLLRESEGAPVASFADFELPMVLAASTLTRQRLAELCAESAPSSGRSIRALLSTCGAIRVPRDGIDVEEFLNANTPAEWRSINRGDDR